MNGAAGLVTALLHIKVDILLKIIPIMTIDVVTTRDTSDSKPRARKEGSHTTFHANLLTAMGRVPCS